MTIKNHITGEPISVELPVSDGRIVVFEMLAENRPTAVAEARRFLKLDVLYAEGDYEEYSDELKDTWLDSFGITGWRGYRVETAAV